MAVITGATVTFTDYSAPTTPRILNIPDAWGNANLQDIWDTLSEIAADLDNLIYKKLIQRNKSGGKITLSATKQVGITLTTNNLQVRFPDQPGPTTVRKEVTDGNLVAEDHNGDSMKALAISTFTFAELELDTSAAITGGFTRGEIH